jgi:hypothetical protein
MSRKLEGSDAVVLSTLTGAATVKVTGGKARASDLYDVNVLGSPNFHANSTLRGSKPTV